MIKSNANNPAQLVAMSRHNTFMSVVFTLKGDVYPRRELYDYMLETIKVVRISEVEQQKITYASPPTGMLHPWSLSTALSPRDLGIRPNEIPH